ncbi:MAG: type I DNA topoisomerase [Candidatus Methanomethylicaceae archaeon]
MRQRSKRNTATTNHVLYRNQHKPRRKTSSPQSDIQPAPRNTRTKLVVVESPAKAKTIGSYLGNDYTVVASFGHLFDLPKHELGIDINRNFTPRFVLLEGRQRILENIKQSCKYASTVLLATDPDREGEAIAWHIQRAIHAQYPNLPTYRITFNAITKTAIQEALKKPRPVDLKLVNAQITRRLIDRLVGYLISQQLWRAFNINTLSAGRVQSTALRLVVERERAIQAFQPKPYWLFFAEFTLPDNPQPFQAQLIAINDKPVKVENQEEAQSILASLKTLDYSVATRTEKITPKYPPPPFITSTLQQAAARILKLSPETTMHYAQILYEGIEVQQKPTGLITYMRTDSPRVAPEAQAQARDWIAKNLGAHFLPEKPRQFHSRSNAQDAHEAIRPTLVSYSPDYLDKLAAWKSPLPELYRLIWQRFLASQAAPARFNIITVNIQGSSPHTNLQVTFRVRASQLLFPGFLALYPDHEKEEAIAKQERSENSENEDEKELPTLAHLPDLKPGDKLILHNINAEQRWTKPPPHFSEASLIRQLEQLGIGRPSTYATILQRLKERQYTYLSKGTLRASKLGEQVCDFLTQHFPTFMDVRYTASMEKALDDIEKGTVTRQKVVETVYQHLTEMLSKLQSKEKPSA